MGIILDNAHRADSDALAAGLVLHRLRQKIGDVSAAKLIERCDVRRAEQDADFNSWLQKQQARNPTP
jgi:hypothetical protein